MEIQMRSTWTASFTEPRTMRRVDIYKGDYATFHNEISPVDFDFFRNHSSAFRRMWREQRKLFWSILIETYDDFVWNHGVVKDIPFNNDDKRSHVKDIMTILRRSFVEGNEIMAKNMIMDIVVLAQNKHHVTALEKGSFSQNPFFMKETREPFRRLFGEPNAKSTFLKLLCGIPIYIKFAGTVVYLLRKWLSANELESYFEEQTYLDSLGQPKGKIESTIDPLGARDLEMIIAELKKHPEASKALASTNGSKMVLKGITPNVLQLVPESVPEFNPVIVESNSSFTSSRPPPDITSSKLSTNDEKKKKKKKVKSVKSLIKETKLANEEKSRLEQKTDSKDQRNDKDDKDVSGAEKKLEKNGENEEEVKKRKLKLHVCGNCSKSESHAKQYKRCVKCRGSHNPKYYCSKDCQVIDWNNRHRLEHIEEEDVTG